MRVFDGRKATDEYMSAHTLAFSTPELTLIRFAFWLGDIIPDPDDKTKTMPRMMAFMTEQEAAPVLVDEDVYVPTGAVKSSGMYGNAAASGVRFCFECGNKMSGGAKFCNKCGKAQD